MFRTNYTHIVTQRLAPAGIAFGLPKMGVPTDARDNARSALARGSTA